MPNFTSLKAPTSGTAISRKSGHLVVPDNPIIPFIEGDGTGRDIWRASVRVLDAAVEKAYGGKKKIAWMEVYAGEKSFKQFSNWLPDDTVEAFREYYVGIKGPLTTPVGGGIRSLNVALRQLLDLYVCLRPVRWYQRRAFANPAPGEGGYGDLPGKHGRHLRRHRIHGRFAGGPEGVGILRERVPQGFQEDPVRHGRGRTNLAGTARGHWRAAPGGWRRGRPGTQGRQPAGNRTPGAQRHQLRRSEQAQERDAGAQGQHHEVHRGGLPRLGLSGREGLLRRRGNRRRAVVPDS